MKCWRAELHGRASGSSVVRRAAARWQHCPRNPSPSAFFVFGFLWVRPTRRVFLPVFTVGLDERRSEHERQSAGCAGGEHRCTRAVHVSEGQHARPYTHVYQESSRPGRQAPRRPVVLPASQAHTQAGRQAGTLQARGIYWRHRSVLSLCLARVPDGEASEPTTSTRRLGSLSEFAYIFKKILCFRCLLPRARSSCMLPSAARCDPVWPSVALSSPWTRFITRHAHEGDSGVKVGSWTAPSPSPGRAPRITLQTVFTAGVGPRARLGGGWVTRPMWNMWPDECSRKYGNEKDATDTEPNRDETKTNSESKERLKFLTRKTRCKTYQVFSFWEKKNFADPLSFPFLDSRVSGKSREFSACWVEVFFL